MRSRPRSPRLLAALFAAVALSSLSCGREPTGPGGAGGTRWSHGITFTPEFPSGFSEYQRSAQSVPNGAGALVTFAKVRIVLRFADGSLALDVVVDFPPGSDELPVPLSIPLPANAPSGGVPLSMTLQYINAAGETVFSGGPVTVTAIPATPGAGPPPPSAVNVPLTYTGPGAATATQVRITPRTLTANTGQALSFSAQALDASGNPLSGVPILFTSDSPVLASINPATGAGVAGPTRGTVNIIAQLLTGPTDVAALTIVSPPARLAAVSGGGQTGPVGSTLAQPVVVVATATDGQPAPGVIVTFAAGNGGSVGNGSVTTGDNGQAATTWRLGPGATEQTLSATAGGLSGSPVTFTATARAIDPVRLEFAQQPPASSAAGAALTPAVTVRAVDATGALTPAFQGTVALALSPGAPANSVLSGTKSVTAVAGVATFPDLAINVPGSYTLAAASGTLTGATSSSFQIVAGAANRLVFQHYPVAGAKAGAVLDPITVEVRDALGNANTSFTGPVTLTATGPVAATALDSAVAGDTTDSRALSDVLLAGPVTVNAVAGIATFSSLQINAAGTYALTATSSGLVSATGPSFPIAAGPASTLVHVSGGGQSGPGSAALPNPVVVKVTDAVGNGISGVLVDFTPAAGSGVVTPATVTTTAGGTAQTVWTLGGTAGAMTLNVSATGLTPNPLVITATATTTTVAVATQLVFTTGPVNTTAGSVMPALVVTAKDALGAVVTTYTGFVNISINPNAAGAVISNGTTGVAAVAGVATFPGVEIQKAAAGLTMKATDGTIQGTSAPFTISAATATQIVADSGGAQTATVGTAVTNQLVARVTDTYNNPATGTTVVWNVATGGGALTGTTTLTDANGRVRTGWTLGAAAGAQTVTATNASLTGSPLTFTATATVGAATTLVFSPGPTTSVAGAGILPAMEVAARDALNNAVPSFTGSVTLAFGANPGGAVLSGTTTVAAVGGVATFAGISLNKVGTGYTLVATSVPALTPATSATFDVTPGPATLIVVESGNVPAQSAAVGAVLGTPFVARVTDALGNPIAGHAVTWNVTGGGGSLSGATTTTDAAGRVSATLTLGPAAGVNTVTATATGIATPATFTANAFVVVANKTWAGTAGTDWNDANNWTPVGVPTATDSVVIVPAANQPVLTGAAFATRFTMQSGTTLNLSFFNLDASGHVNVPATGVTGSGGKIRMNGANVTVVGVFTNLEIFGGLTTATGSVTVTGALTITGGRFDVGGFTTTVGSLTTSGSGAPRMQSPASVLNVQGTASWNSANVFGDSLLTAGTLNLLGGMNIGCGGGNFNAGGTHLTVAAGTGPQTISGGCSSGGGPTQEHFRNLTIANTAAPVTLTGSLTATGVITVPAGATLAGAANLQVVAAQLSVAGTYTVSNTTFSGNATTVTLPALTFNTLTLDGVGTFVVPASGWAVTNTFAISNNAVLDVANGVGTVGTMTFSGNAHLRMQHPSGDLTVNGAASWNTQFAYGDTAVTAGTLRVKGNWSMSCSGPPGVFNASGTHTVVFSGTAIQTVFNGCAAGTASTQEHFANIVIANTAASVSIPGLAHVTGTLTVNAGATLFGAGTAHLPATGLVNNGTYTVGNTTLHGTGGTTALPAFAIPALLLDGTHIFTVPAAGFSVTGNLQVQNGATLDVGANAATVGSFNAASAPGPAGRLRMQHPAGQLTVLGAATWSASNIWGDTLLTAGTLRVRGAWQPGCSGSETFNASGTHTVIFDGTSAQTVNGGCASGYAANKEHFQNVVIANTAASVSFSSTYHVKGTVTVNAGATLAGSGTLHSRAGNIVNNGTYAITNSTIVGTLGATTLPVFSFNNLTLDSAHVFAIPATGFAVTGTLTLQNGTSVDLGSSAATLNHLNITSLSKLRMQHPSGSLTTTGTLQWNSIGVWGDSLLTAGTLHVKGGWTVGCGGTAFFNAAGTHTVVLDGTVAQSIGSGCASGALATQEHFRNLIVNNTSATASFGGTYVATGAVTVTAGATLAGGGTLSVSAGALTNNGTYTITNTTFLGTAAVTTLPAFTLPNLKLDGTHVFQLPATGFAVSGSLVLDNGATLDVGSGVATVSALNMINASKVRMQHPSGSLTTTGTLQWNSLGVWGDSLLTAGTLHVKGGWTMGCGGTAYFNAAGTHTVVFDGAAGQSIGNGCASGALATQEHFNNVQVSNTGGTVTLGSHRVQGLFTVDAGATIGGASTLTLAGGASLAPTSTINTSTVLFTGSGGTTNLPAKTFVNLTLDGAHTFVPPATGLSATGNTNLQNSALLAVGSATVNLGTSLSVASNAHLSMLHPSGDVTVGTANWLTGGWGDTLLTAGTLRVRGNWTMTCAGTAQFNAAGTHTVVFEGTAAQSVASGCSAGTGVAQEHFQNVSITNTAATVSFTGAGNYIHGTIDVAAGATMGGSGTINVAGGTFAVSGTYSVTNTTMFGTGGASTLPALTFPNLILDGTHVFTAPATGFGVTGNFVVQNSATFDLGTGTASSNGTMTILTLAKLRMQQTAAHLTVNNITWTSAGVWGDSLLTAGVIDVTGNWSLGCTGSGAFNASGTHKVLFIGSAAQTVSTGCAAGPGPSQEHFATVRVVNTTATVTFSGSHHINDEFSLYPSTSATGGTLFLRGSWSFGAGSSAGSTAYNFVKNGGAHTLPGATLSSVTVDSAARFVIPASGFAVTNTLTASNGAVLDVDAGTASAGSLAMNSASRLRMKDAAGVLTVNGAANFNATGVQYRDTSMTAGTLRVSGAIGSGCGADVFNTAGTHIIEVFGTGSPSINPCATKGVTADLFHLRELRVNKTSGTLTIGAIDIIGETRLMAGTLSSATATAWGELIVTGGTLTGGGMTLRYAGQAIPSNTLGTVTLKANATIGGGVTSGTIVADSGQLDVIGNATISGNFSTSHIGTLRMQAAATLTVTGTANFAGASTLGLLTNGRLEVGSHFTQASSSSTSFAADNAHVTVFNGTAAQNVSMANPSASLGRFAALENRNTSAGGVIFTTDAVVKGDLVVPAAANDTVRFGMSGSRTLTVGGVNVSNTGNTRAKFNALPLVISSFGLGTISQFDGAVFSGHAVTANQLTFSWGQPGAFTFNNLTFTTAPTSGKYVVMNSLSTSLTLVGTTPSTPGGLSQVVSGVLNWP